LTKVMQQCARGLVARRSSATTGASIRYDAAAGITRSRGDVPDDRHHRAVDPFGAGRRDISH
jgi:hypothetical protein